MGTRYVQLREEERIAIGILLKGGMSIRGISKELYVRDKLFLGWSPERVAGGRPLEHPDLSVSHEAIYLFLYYLVSRISMLENFYLFYPDIIRNAYDE